MARIPVLKIFRTSVALVLLLAVASGGVGAQEELGGEMYRLGPGDVLQLSVWQQPQYDRQLHIRDDGTVIVPLIGEIEAAGSTLPELEDLLSRRLRAFSRDITEVSLTVVSYRSLQLFIMGSVSSPGAHTFDTVPTIWDALRAAGGPQSTANLRRVRILRQTEGGTTIQVVNVAGLMQGGEGIADLPPLESGDTIIVPDATAMSPADRESGVHVMGAVASPGLYPVDEPTPLMTVVLQAGGFGGDADLQRVRVVHPTLEGPVEARAYNVRLFLENGQMGSNPLVLPGDTVFVEDRASVGQWLRSVPGLLSAGTALVALIINLAP